MIWPWTSYLARVLADAYDDFEQRVIAEGKSTKSKQERVRDYILGQAPEEFRRRDVERALPGISPATIRLVLNELRNAQRIRPEGSGPGARWHRLDASRRAPGRMRGRISMREDFDEWPPDIGRALEDDQSTEPAGTTHSQG